MKLLVAFIIERLGMFFSKIVGFMSKKAALVALLAAISVMVVAFTTALSGVLASATASVSHPLIIFGLSLLPSNTTTVITLIGTARAAQWLFIWQVSVARATFDAK